MPVQEGLNLLREIIRVDEANFPEVLRRLFIIRAPTAFTAIWKLVKPWLDQRTLAKIEICGYYDYLNTMQLEIDLEQIPQELGGKCACPKGCFDKRRGGIFSGKWDGRAHSIVVGRSDSAEITVDATKGCTVCYEFETEFYDIGFGLSFLPAAGGAKKEILEQRKVEAYQVMEEGKYELLEDGCVILHFDNTYSWTRGKTVNYKVSRGVIVKPVGFYCVGFYCVGFYCVTNSYSL